MIELTPGEARSLTGEPVEIENKQVSIVTALARPKQFVEMVQAKGAQVFQTKTFRDHSFLSHSKWMELVSKLQVPIVITEKDAVKISGEQKNIVVLGLKAKADERLRNILNSHFSIAEYKDSAKTRAANS